MNAINPHRRACRLLWLSANLRSARNEAARLDMVPEAEMIYAAMAAVDSQIDRAGSEAEKGEGSK